MKNIEIEFFHDVICSFCYPMSERMRQLQKEYPEITIIHRSFALVKKDEDFVTGFGSRENAKAEIVTHWEQANQNGEFNKFNIEGMLAETFPFPSSILPLKTAKAAGLVNGQEAYWDIFDALQFALFTENRDIGDMDVIHSIIEESTLDFDQWEEAFESEEVEKEIEKDLRLVASYGIQSVPSLVINKKHKISGAVPMDTLVTSLKEINENS